MVAAISVAVERTRQRSSDTADPDSVSQDILLDVAADLEKQAWMFEAQRADNI
jgi:starvation-inducible DNA-binding protein